MEMEGERGLTPMNQGWLRKTSELRTRTQRDAGRKENPKCYYVFIERPSLAAFPSYIFN